MSHKKVLLSTFSQISGRAITAICGLFTVKLITSVGQGFYGDYVTTYEFLAFFGIIADAGLFSIAVKDMSQSESKKNPKHSTEFILANILSIRLIFILGVCTLAAIIAQWVPTYSESVQKGIILTSISMGLTIVAGTLSSVLQARMKIHYFSGSLAFAKVILAGLIFYLIQDFKATGTFSEVNAQSSLFQDLLWVGVFSNILFLGLVFFFVSRLIKIRLGYNKVYWKETLKISLPYGIALILQTLYLRMDIVIISLLLTPKDTGLYGVCTRIMESFLLLGVIFGQSILPKISAEMSSEDPILPEKHLRVKETLQWGMEKVLIVSLPLVWGTWIFSKDLILLLSNTDFLSTSTQVGSERLLIILVPTVLFAYFNQLFTFTLISKNRQNYLLFINLFAVLLNGSLNWYFLPIYGISAAAFTTVLSEVIVFISLFRAIKKEFKPQFWTKNVIELVGFNLVLFNLYRFTFLGENLFLGFIAGLGFYTLFFFKNRRKWL